MKKPHTIVLKINFPFFFSFRLHPISQMSQIMAAKPELDIEIGGENYRLDTLPADTSSVVVAEKEKLLGAVDLKTVLNDLDRVGPFIRIAYNGVKAAGPKFTTQQSDIRRLGYDVTELFDKSLLTVAKFKKASTTILTDLPAAILYLFDNLEHVTVKTLSKTSKLADEMEKAALELHHDFEQQAGKVEYTLESCNEALGIQELQKQHQQFEDKKQEQMKLMEEAQRLEHEAEEDRRRIEEKEDEAISSIGSNSPLKLLVNGVMDMLGIGKVFENEAEKKAAHWKERRIEALQVENKFRQHRWEALLKTTELGIEIKAEQKMAEVAVDALFLSIGALKELTAVMMDAARFWKQMQDHCHSLEDSEVQQQVEKVMKKFSEENRRKVWTSKVFKRKVITCYTGWVALHSVCSIYIEQIKKTQRDLYEYLKENPTWEESRKNVKSLAETFLSDLKLDQKAIADKEFQALEEIKALTLANPEP